jgi:hypothetical protein
MSSASPVVVVYHYPCPDGAFAALAAHLYFISSNTQEQNVDFYPQPVYEKLDVTNALFTGKSTVYMYVQLFKLTSKGGLFLWKSFTTSVMCNSITSHFN